MILFRKVVKFPFLMLMTAMALPGRTTDYKLGWGYLQMVWSHGLRQLSVVSVVFQTIALITSSLNQIFEDWVNRFLLENTNKLCKRNRGPFEVKEFHLKLSEIFCKSTTWSCLNEAVNPLPSFQGSLLGLMRKSEIKQLQLFPPEG